MTTKREPPLKIPMQFDAAIGTALGVAPPAGGWAEYEKSLKASKPKAKKKASTKR